MKRLSLLMFCAWCAGAQAQVLSNPDQATINRLGLVFERVQPVGVESGTAVSARVMGSPLQADAVVARFSGVIEQWRVAPGDAVKQGDVIGLVRSSDVLALQQSYLEANATLQQTQAARARDQKLLDEGVIAAQRFQQTERDYQAARAGADALGAQLNLAGIDSEARKTFDSQSASLGLYSLRAPNDGVVGRVQANVGDAVEPAQRLVEISAARLWLEADLPASLAKDMDVGQSLRTPGIAPAATLRQMDRQVDPRTQTLTIRAEFDDAVDLRAGQIVSLVLTPTSGGWHIPADAVVHNGATTEVFIRTAAGIEARQLNLQPLGTDYLASEGMNGDEQLVVRGAALLKGMSLGLGGE